MTTSYLIQRLRLIADKDLSQLRSLNCDVLSSDVLLLEVGLRGREDRVSLNLCTGEGPGGRSEKSQGVGRMSGGQGEFGKRSSVVGGNRRSEGDHE